ncbi:MAG: metallophosphoesterase [Candidatus Bathyarchaeota archaeon]|nr:MAG: metallophosphoesterase [Candidatus Bathyarchaeota archaeon]
MMPIKPIQPYPALLLRRKSERVLVVADLHIGWEAPLTQKGVHVPSQTPKILDKILRLIKTCEPTRIIFLGDVKHAIAKVEMEEWRDVPDFFEALEKKVADIQVIPGNHDGNLEPLLPETIKILPSTGVVFGNVGLFHGHAWPAPELLGCRSLVTGHLHPMVAFRDPMGFRITRQVWVKAACNGQRLAKSVFNRLGVKVNANPSVVLLDQFNVRLRVSQLFIMPSFNEFLGGQPINKRKLGKGAKSGAFIGPVLRSGSINLDDAETYLLDGTFLGNVNQLKTLS